VTAVVTCTTRRPASLRTTYSMRIVSTQETTQVYETSHYRVGFVYIIIAASRAGFHIYMYKWQNASGLDKSVQPIHPACLRMLYITLSLSVQLPRSISAYSCASTSYITLVSAFELDLYSIGLQASAPTNKAIHRVKWRHRVYGHSDTIAILWV